MTAEVSIDLYPIDLPVRPQPVQAQPLEQAPDLDWQGSFAVRQHWVQPVGALGSCVFVAGAAAATMGAVGWGTQQGLVAGLVAALPAFLAARRFERVTLGNRRYSWYGHAVRSAGSRRRSDAERLQAMAASAAAGGVVWQGEVVR